MCVYYLSLNWRPWTGYGQADSIARFTRAENGMMRRIARVALLAAALLPLIGVVGVFADAIPRTAEERKRVLASLPTINGPNEIYFPAAAAAFDLTVGMNAVVGPNAARAVPALMGSNCPGAQAVIVIDGKVTMLIDYQETGFVDLGGWDAVDPGALLEALRKNLAENSARRQAVGLAAGSDLRWIAKPQINRRLAIVHWTIGFDTAGIKAMNIVALHFGRSGVTRMVLAAPETWMEQNARAIGVFETNFRYDPGARYEDKREGDKTASSNLLSVLAANSLTN